MKEEAKMKKCLFCILALIVLVGGLAGCAGAERSRENLPQSTRQDRGVIAAASAAAQARLVAEVPGAGGSGPARDLSLNTTFLERDDGAVVFHVAHQFDPTHTLHRGLLRFKNEVETRSEGSLIVEVFSNTYGLGGDVALRDMVIDNQLDAAAITIWGTWHTMTELANFESLPFVFSNYGEAWAAYEGTLGQWVARNIIEPNGARVLGFYTNGLRHFTNNVRPIYTPADMVGLRMRSPQIATNLAMYEEFGAASVSMALGPLYDALAAGTVDGQDNPIAVIHSSRFHEVQRYLSLSNHMFSSAPLIVSTDFWYSLSAEHQQILLESSAIASRYQGELTMNMEQSQMQEIIASGTQVNVVDANAFMAAVEDIWIDHVERFGNEFITIASRYISDPNSLAHRFGS